MIRINVEVTHNDGSTWNIPTLETIHIDLTNEIIKMLHDNPTDDILSKWQEVIKSPHINVIYSKICEIIWRMKSLRLFEWSTSCLNYEHIDFTGFEMDSIIQHFSAFSNRYTNEEYIQWLDYVFKWFQQKQLKVFGDYGFARVLFLETVYKNRSGCDWILKHIEPEQLKKHLTTYLVLFGLRMENENSMSHHEFVSFLNFYDIRESFHIKCSEYQGFWMISEIVYLLKLSLIDPRFLECIPVLQFHKCYIHSFVIQYGLESEFMKLLNEHGQRLHEKQWFDLKKNVDMFRKTIIASMRRLPCSQVGRIIASFSACWDL